MQEIKVRATFTDEVLGTSSNNPEIHDEFIASKAKDPDGKSNAEKRAEEIDAIGVGNYIEKQMTVFPRTEDGKPFIWDYQIKGFFKDTCAALKKDKSTKSSKLAAFKKIIDGCVFIKERKLVIQNYKRIGECQRPLRGQTPQGERIALAHSETVPEGSYIEFTVQAFEADAKGAKLVDLISEWLAYGKFRGLLQWRNSGKGRFTTAVLEPWHEVDAELSI